jgi:hypothetical protein
MSRLAFVGAFVLLTQFASGAEPPSNRGIRRETEGDVEFVIRGSMMSELEFLGRVPNKNYNFDMAKLFDGKEVSHTSCHLDANGFRQSSASHLPGKTKNLLLIGASALFGLGIQDEETVTHLVNERSKTYEAYGVSYIAMGLQHFWLVLRAGSWKCTSATTSRKK